MSGEVKARLWEVLKKYGITLGICLAYLILVLSTGWGLVCVFYELTGLQCPSCGISHLFLALLRLEIGEAFRFNPYLFIHGPIILFCFLFSDVMYVKGGGRSHEKWVDFVLICEIVLAIAFAVHRNIPEILAFLQKI